jgi:hypothetical protein
VVRFLLPIYSCSVHVLWLVFGLFKNALSIHKLLSAIWDGKMFIYMMKRENWKKK